MSTIIIKNGHVLDSIEVNGRRFGGSGGYTTTQINLAQGEKVTTIKYNPSRSNSKQHCNLYFVTTVRTYGPYVTDPPQCDTGNVNMVTKHVIDGFFSFLIKKSGTVTDGQITFSV